MEEQFEMKEINSVSNPSQKKKSSKNFLGFFCDVSYCLNNQLNRIYGNLVLLTTIVLGAYFDVRYYTYSIKNPYERKFHGPYVFFFYCWTTFIFLACSSIWSTQTNIETLTQSKSDDIYGRPIVKINKLFSGYCEFCKAKKHERSSHCKQCGVCVLRRDHHCPALGKCVGYQNTQLFCNLVASIIVFFLFSLRGGIIYARHGRFIKILMK